MRLSDMAKLASQNKSAIPEIIRMIAESLENSDGRFDNIEKVLRDIAPKIGAMTTQINELTNNINTLNNQIKSQAEEIAILKVWLNKTPDEPRPQLQKNSKLLDKLEKPI